MTRIDTYHSYHVLARQDKFLDLQTCRSRPHTRSRRPLEKTESTLVTQDIEFHDTPVIPTLPILFARQVERLAHGTLALLKGNAPTIQSSSQFSNFHTKSVPGTMRKIEKYRCVTIYYIYHLLYLSCKRVL